MDVVRICVATVSDLSSESRTLIDVEKWGAGRSWLGPFVPLIGAWPMRGGTATPLIVFRAVVAPGPI